MTSVFSPSTPEPVGFYCDHSGEPADARTHHDWEFVDGGFVFTHQPEIIRSHGGTQDYLKPEQREQRCPRAVPVYAVDVPSLLAELADRDRTVGYYSKQSQRRKAELQGARATVTELTAARDAARTDVESLRDQLAAVCGSTTVAERMQEQQQFINTLTARVTELEARPTRAQVLREAARKFQTECPEAGGQLPLCMCHAADPLRELADTAEAGDRR